MKFLLHRDELKRQFPDLKITKEYYEFKGEKIDNTRSPSQNNSLHKVFADTATECVEKGIDMRILVRDNIPIEVTPQNIKWLWKEMQKYLLMKESTTQLEKNGEIDYVYDNLNKLLINRTDGEVCLPEWPSKKKQIKETPKIDYPNNVNNEITAF